MNFTDCLEVENIVVLEKILDAIVKNNDFQRLRKETFFIIRNVNFREDKLITASENMNFVFSVVWKILNRGSYTLFTQEVENEIVEDFSDKMDGYQVNDLRKLEGDVYKDILGSFYTEFDEKDILLIILFKYLSLFQKGVFLALHSLPSDKRDLVVVTDINDVISIPEEILKKYLLLVSNEVVEIIERVCRIYSIYDEKFNIDIRFWNEIGKNPLNDTSVRFVFNFCDEEYDESLDFYGIFDFIDSNHKYISGEKLKGRNISVYLGSSSGFYYFGKILRAKYRPNVDDLEFFLNFVFRKKKFRDGQYEGICRVLMGEDTLLLLPTGAGKSLVYQLSSLLIPGVCLIIDPIKSLMDDQAESLFFFGIDRVSKIHSDMSFEQKEKNKKLIRDGKVFFIFVSPERLQIMEFEKIIKELKEKMPISVAVIDEAHCVSEWGHDFRTSYLNLRDNIEKLCSRNEGNKPVILALTGTASSIVLDDILRDLRLPPESKVSIKSFKRNELKFYIIRTSRVSHKSSNLEEILSQKLKKLLGKDIFKRNERGEYEYIGIIFTIFARSGKDKIGVKSLYKDILPAILTPPKDFPYKVFTGEDIGEDLGIENYVEYKKNLLYDFKRNKIPFVIATKAFGMGIDNPNVRYTIHYAMPQSIESFYQEAGRAGRGGKNSYCFLIFSPEIEVELQSRLSKHRDIVGRYNSIIDCLLDTNLPYAVVREIYQEVEEILQSIGCKRGDIMNVLYFHFNNFVGLELDKKMFEIVFNKIEEDLFLGMLDSKELSKEIIKTIGNKADSRNNFLENSIEKIIYRLKKIGYIEDYKMEYIEDKNFAYNDGFKRIYYISKSKYDKEKIKKFFDSYVAMYFGEYYIKNSRAFGGRKYLERFLKSYEDPNISDSEFVKITYETFLEFVYDVIENTRRRAIQEMYRACLEEDKFEERILSYLEVYDEEEIRNAIKGPNIGIELALQKVSYLSDKDIHKSQKLAGVTARLLTDIPSHPTLLFLRSISGFYIGEKDEVLEDLINSIIGFLDYIPSIKDKDEEYKIEIIEMIGSMLREKIFRFDKEFMRRVIFNVFQRIKDRENKELLYFVHILNAIDREFFQKHIKVLKFYVYFRDTISEIEIFEKNMEEIYGKWGEK